MRVTRVPRVVGRELLDLLDLEQAFDVVGAHGRGRTQRFVAHRIFVLIGRDLSYDPLTGKILTDKSQISRDDKSSGIRGASDDVARRLILNTYKTLLTRGQKGCFVYCEDEGLREYFKEMIGK